MPYQEIQVEAEVAFIHNNITVYHTYKDDNFVNGPSKYFFSFDPLDQEETSFDVRELADNDAIYPKIPFLNSDVYLNGADGRCCINT